MQRLMRVMGLESVAPKPDTSKPHPEHPVYPYLLRNLAISQPNQVWATDITYIPMAFHEIDALGVVHLAIERGPIARREAIFRDHDRFLVPLPEQARAPIHGLRRHQPFER